LGEGRFPCFFALLEMTYERVTGNKGTLLCAVNPDLQYLYMGIHLTQVTLFPDDIFIRDRFYLNGVFQKPIE
jgi:hypothetical protein